MLSTIEIAWGKRGFGGMHAALRAVCIPPTSSPNPCACQISPLSDTQPSPDVCCTGKVSFVYWWRQMLEEGFVGHMVAPDFFTPQSLPGAGKTGSYSRNPDRRLFVCRYFRFHPSG